MYHGFAEHMWAMRGRCGKSSPNAAVFTGIHNKEPYCDSGDQQAWRGRTGVSRNHQAIGKSPLRAVSSFPEKRQTFGLGRLLVSADEW